MGIFRKLVFFLLILVFSKDVLSDDMLIRENHQIFFKSQGVKIFLFDAAGYCFDENAFSIESLTADQRKYLFVNFTEDCNPSGMYKIFELVNGHAEKFYLSALYDPEFISTKKQIIERYKDGAVSYKRIYALKNNKYQLLEELKTLGDQLNLSTDYANKKPKYILKDDLGQRVKSILVSATNAFLYDRYFNRTKKYLIKDDELKIKTIEKYKGVLYVYVEYDGSSVPIKGYVKLEDFL